MSRSSAKKKASLSLTPEQAAFLDDSSDAAHPTTTPTRTIPQEVLSPRVPQKTSFGDMQIGPLPRSHRLQASGKVVRRVTGFVSFDLGRRFEDYLEAEERTASYVLERALKSWLDAR